MLDLVVILGLGAFGGLLNHLYIHNNVLFLPGLEKQDGRIHVNLGFLAEVVLGMGGAMAAAYLLTEEAAFFRQAAVALLGGFGGGGLLAQNAVTLEQQRAMAFQQISKLLISTTSKPLKLEDSPLQLVKVLAQLEQASSKQRINRLRGEALSILQNWSSDKKIAEGE